MIRLWRRRRREPTPSAEVLQAAEQTRRDLADIQAQWPEVQRLSASLRGEREANHFGERLVEAFNRRSA